MTDNGPSNITQILKAFHRFLLAYENPLWVKSASIEDIKTTFKLGDFIEKTVESFKIREFLAQFLILLEVWGKGNNIKPYREEFYANINDYLLAKLFKCPNIKESTLDISVRVYTTLYSKQRFKECIKKVIMQATSLKAITDFVNCSIADRNIVASKVILAKWDEYCKQGLSDLLQSEIDLYLSLYNVEERLPTLITILSLTVKTDPKDFLLNSILTKMLDRSALSKIFWLTLFKKVNLTYTKAACKNYSQFLQSTLNFIEYLGSMMTYDGSKWCIDKNSCFCHEITYVEIVVMLKTMCCESELKTVVLDRINKAKEFGNDVFWTEVVKDISE